MNIDHSNYLLYAEEGYIVLQCKRCLHRRADSAVRWNLAQVTMWSVEHEADCEVVTDFAERRRKFIETLDAQDAAVVIPPELGELLKVEAARAEALQDRDVFEIDEADAEIARLRRILRPEDFS